MYKKRNGEIDKTPRKVNSARKVLRITDVHQINGDANINKSRLNQFRKCRVTSHDDVTESRESPGVGNFDGGTERNVRVQLGDAQGIGAATVRRARSFTYPRAPVSIRVTLITATDPRKNVYVYAGSAHSSCTICHPSTNKRLVSMFRRPIARPLPTPLDGPWTDTHTDRRTNN